MAQRRSRGERDPPQPFACFIPLNKRMVGPRLFSPLQHTRFFSSQEDFCPSSITETLRFIFFLSRLNEFGPFPSGFYRPIKEGGGGAGVRPQGMAARVPDEHRPHGGRRCKLRIQYLLPGPPACPGGHQSLGWRHNSVRRIRSYTLCIHLLKLFII